MRVAVAQLGPAEGLLREGLSSLREVFGSLGRFCAAVAQDRRAKDLIWYLAVGVLSRLAAPLPYRGASRPRVCAD